MVAVVTPAMLVVIAVILVVVMMRVLVALVMVAMSKDALVDVMMADEELILSVLSLYLS